MSYIQIESLVNPWQKNAYGKHRRSITTVAIVVVGTTVLGLALLSGVFHFKALPLVQPMTTSIALRPDYPVSTFLYERGAFSWFLGVAVSIVGGAVAFASLGTGCVVVTGGVAISSCVLAAVGVGFTVTAIIQNSLTARRLRLAQQAMIYMDYADKSSKREIEAHEHFNHTALLHHIYGPNADYRYEATITENDPHNAHLVTRNNGSHVPIFSFSTPEGIRLHHVMIENRETGGNFHRFGFQSDAHAKRASMDPVANTEEFFNTGGIDILDCPSDDANHLSNNDNDNENMQRQLICQVPMFDDVTELGVQVFDATTSGTISSGRIAPFDASGDSQLIDNGDFSGCPSGLGEPNSCPQESDSD